MSADEAKAAAKHIADNLQATRQVQIFLEPASISMGLGAPAKDSFLFCTNLRVMIMRRKSGLLNRPAIKHSYSILDMDSLECTSDPTCVRLGLRSAKEVIVLSIKLESAAVVERLTSALYECVRAFHSVRGPALRTGVVPPPKPGPPTTAKALSDLYLAVCDRAGLEPVASFLEMLASNKGDELNIRAATAGKDGGSVGRITYQDLQAMCDSLCCQDMFTGVLLPDNVTLADEAITAIGSVVFSVANRINRMTCAGNNWSSRNAPRIIADAMKGATSKLLTKLVLRNQALGDEGLEALLIAAQSSQMPLQTLVASNCGLSGKGDLFNQPLLSPALVTLDLSKNDNISKAGASALTEYLHKPSALKRLSLAMTNLDLEPIVGALMENPDLSLKQLETLNVAGLKISSKAASSLKAIIGQTASLSHVILDRIRFTDFFLASLFDGIANNTTGVRFVLSLAYCDLSGMLVKVLVDSVKRHGPLKNVGALGLQYNHISTCDEFQALCEILEQVTSLRHLSLDGNVRLPKLVSHSKKSKQVGDDIVKMFQSLPGLESFSIVGDAQHAIGDAVATILEGAVAHPALKSIDISANAVSEKGFAAVANLLARSKRLVRLDMDNAIPTSSLPAMASALQSNNELPLRVLDIERTVRELAGSSRSTRRLSAVANLIKCLRDRIGARVGGDVQVPASVQNRFAAIRRLDGAFDDIAEDADLYDALNDVVRALPAELFTASTPMSAVRRHLQGSLSSKSGTVPPAIDDAGDDAEGASGSQFGVALEDMDLLKSEDIVRWYPSGVPAVLVQMDHYLDRHDATNSVGIFRLAPDEVDSKAVKRQLNDGTFESCADINSVANNLKVWYRDMPYKLLQGVSVDDMAQCTTSEQTAALIERIKEPYRSLFLWTLDVFVKYSSSSDQSKMNAHNLAIVFSPNFFVGNSADPMADMKAFQVVCKFTESAIAHRATSFDVKSLRSAQKEWQLRYASDDLGSSADPPSAAHDDDVDEPPAILSGSMKMNTSPRSLDALNSIAKVVASKHTVMLTTPNSPMAPAHHVKAASSGGGAISGFVSVDTVDVPRSLSAAPSMSKTQKSSHETMLKEMQALHRRKLEAHGQKS
ncbi:Rho-GAP domain-containing protein [Plasmodiophora brassicae]